MPPELLANVAVRAPVENHRSAILTYRVPLRLRSLVESGQLVWVPLRRQRVQGVVLDIYTAPDAPPADGTHEIADLADAEAHVTLAGIQLARWVASTYRAPLYEALTLLLPPGVAQQAEVTWRATPLGLLADLGALPERERGVLYYLRQHGETSERDLRRELRGGDSELLAIYGDLHQRGMLARGAALSAPRAQPRIITMARLLLVEHEIEPALDDLARAPKQASALRWLVQTTHELDDTRQETGDRRQETKPASQQSAVSSRQAEAVPTSAIAAATGATLATLRALEARGILTLETHEVRRDPLAGDGVALDVPPPLTGGQRAVWEVLSAALDEMTRRQGDKLTDADQCESSITPSPRHHVNPSVYLLHGVTGSGKTEIYLRAIGRVMRLGRQALVLVPEIALTAQLVRRFAARFPGQLAVLHSGLSLGQRYDEWRRLRRGEARLAIGSRSAVFAPLPEVGLIIVDEEHEPTYKHDAGPRYHARDAAVRLGQLTGSVVILGSATPSVESYYATQQGYYHLLELRERVGTTPSVNGLPRSQALPLPPVHLVDMRRELQSGNRSIFSRALQEALAKTLERREQAILFLNRRGVASFVMCRDCGHVLACPACSGPLVVHYENEERGTGNGERGTENGERKVPPSSFIAPRSSFNDQRSALLMCHSCNHRELMPLICPRCLSQRIKAFGVGTQRVEEEVVRLFPQARPLRWDRDSVGQKGAHQRLLDTFLNHEADVLVGTQMIAKGLDLPMVSLVGVVAADTGLHLPDFRSGERAFQLLTQVAGRAGRRTAGAQVILQTYTPEHYALQAAQEHDYHAFYVQEIAFRRQTGYPPLGRLVRLVYSSGSEERCAREAEELAKRVRVLLMQRDDPDEWLIGPAPAFIQRARGRYRWHLLLRTLHPGGLLDALGPLYGWMVDVDAMNVL